MPTLQLSHGFTVSPAATPSKLSVNGSPSGLQPQVALFAANMAQAECTVDLIVPYLCQGALCWAAEEGRAVE